MENLLLIGGTNFIGRNLVERLLQEKRFKTTLLNRGITNVDLFPSLDRIKGDRNTPEIKDLVQGDWDYILDISCYFPRSIQSILGADLPNLKRYIFLSTCSVYEMAEKPLPDERTLIKTCTPEEYDDESAQTYGKRKAACEALLEASGVNYTILRPPLVFGPYDHTDRLYYWLHQVYRYDKVVLPNNGTQTFALCYVQDLVSSIIESIQPEPSNEAFNIASNSQVSISKIVHQACKILGKSPSLLSANTALLETEKIEQWMDMPLWIDNDLFTYHNAKMLRHFDFEVTHLEDGLRATIEYYESLGWPLPKYGITRSQQEALLEKIESPS